MFQLVIVRLLNYSALWRVEIIKESILCWRPNSQQCILESVFDRWSQYMSWWVPECTLRLFKVHHFNFTVALYRPRKIYKFPLLSFTHLLADLICVNHHISNVKVWVFDPRKIAFFDALQPLQEFDSCSTSWCLSDFDNLLIFISDLDAYDPFSINWCQPSFGFEFRKGRESLLDKSGWRCFH